MESITLKDARELRRELWLAAWDELWRMIKTFFLKRYHKEAIAFIREIGKFGDIIADIGCGSGTFLKRFMEEFPQNSAEHRNYRGIDTDRKCIAEAAESYGINGPFEEAGGYYADQLHSIRLIPANAIELPIGNKEVDMVLGIMVFHHIPPSHHQQALKEILRVLKPGGKFLLIEHGRPTNLIGRIAHKLFSGHAHARNCAERVRTICEHIGFSKTEVWGNRTIFGWTHCLVFTKK